MKNTNKEDEIQYNQLALTVNESNRNLSISKQNLRTRNNDVFENVHKLMYLIVTTTMHFIY